MTELTNINMVGGTAVFDGVTGELLMDVGAVDVTALGDAERKYMPTLDWHFNIEKSPADELDEPIAVHERELLMDIHNLNALFAEAARARALIKWNPPFPLPPTARLVMRNPMVSLSPRAASCAASSL